jgi:hypothetical protein
MMSWQRSSPGYNEYTSNVESTRNWICRMSYDDEIGVPFNRIPQQMLNSYGEAQPIMTDEGSVSRIYLHSTMQTFSPWYFKLMMLVHGII